MKRALLSAIVFVLTSAIGVSSAKAQINSPEDAARVCQNAPPPVWALAAIALTTLAETGSAVDYGAIAGDADGQGMSVGLMQWNFGQGTIAPLVARMENVDAVAASTMPTYGARFVAEVRRAGVPDTRAAALAWIRHTQASDNATLRREARAFFRSRESQAAQTALAQDLALDAWRYAQTWMRDVREGCNPTFAQFAVFFDYINHGGATNAAEITRMIAEYGEVRNQYTAQNRAHYSRRIALGEVTWIMGFPHERPCAIPSVERGGGAQAHVWDAQANCQIWRQTVEGGAEVWENELMIFAAMGARFKPLREVFLNRKGTLALGIGVINGQRCDFRSLYGRLEAPSRPTPEQVVAAVPRACSALAPQPA